VSADAQACPRCGRTASIVRGRCPECGAVRDASALPPARSPSVSAPLLPQWLSLALTGSVLVALVVLFALGELLLAAVGLVVLLLVVLAVFGGGLW
jgi:hypothetical protein